MRTRASAYPSPSDGITFYIRPRLVPYKRRKLFVQADTTVQTPSSPSSSFDKLHDELVVSIMVALSSSATAPSDLINAMLACKRFCAAGTHNLVLANVSASALTGPATKWSDGGHMFLQRCTDAGNVEAAYSLGMIRFYCFNDREAGVALMAQAAMKPHAPALHSLAIIQFNGSGATRKDKNLKNGASLCAKAAALAHVDAMRELGHCLQDGYGVPKNVPEGRRLLLEANAREAAAAVAASPRDFLETALHLAQSTRSRCLHSHLYHQHGLHHRSAVAAIHKLEAARRAAISASVAIQTLGHPGGMARQGTVEQGTGQIPVLLHRHPVYRLLHGGGCSLLSDFGCNVPPPKIHVANKFLVEWFSSYPPVLGLRLCSHASCGRPEMRKHEFRRCSACGTVNYCSRACQALDWKLRHKYHCRPVADWEAEVDDDDQAADDEDYDADGNVLDDGVVRNT
ncbi:hypothetical protein L7F22_006368 [Adiantum nelumboides]|nr:hypothetical protein [Adiantum nelumboides]